MCKTEASQAYTTKAMNTIYYEEIDSTNAELRRLVALCDMPNWSTVWAGFQTAGRGQRGNTWESERDANIAASLWVNNTNGNLNSYPFDLCVIASISVKHLLQQYLPPHRLFIKWPNDIFVEHKKICGILIENEWSGNTLLGSIIGIGINIQQLVFRGLPNATSLAIEVNKPLPPLVHILHQLQYILQENYTKLLSNRTAIWDEYLGCLYLKDDQFHPFEIRTPKQKKVVAAKIVTVDKSGALHLYIADTQKTETFAFKEVAYIINGTPEAKP